MKKILLIITCFLFINVGAKEEYKKIEKKQGINIEGNLVEYININSKYIEKGATFYDEKGNDLSNDIYVTYFNNGRQVSSIDTRFLDNYIVKYQIKYKNKKYESSKIVIITDTESPSFNEFETETITVLDTATYNPKDNVKAKDNSSKVKVKCYNSISMLKGNYTITCQAKDENGNITTKNKLVKVIDNIKFKYKNNLQIIFPEGNYTYMYSINGNEFIKCNRVERVKIKEGYVNALVYENNELIMNNTYLAK